MIFSMQIEIEHSRKIIKSIVEIHNLFYKNYIKMHLSPIEICKSENSRIFA